MKKLLLSLVFTSVSTFSFGQSKSTPLMTAASNSIGMSATVVLDNTTSKVFITINGPSDRWFGITLGSRTRSSMEFGDVLTYSGSTPTLTDRNFGTNGTNGAPPIDASQDWTIDSNTVAGTVRTLTISRNLTNTDTNDFQLPYSTTSSINMSFIKAASATTSVGVHNGGTNVGTASANFTTLGIDGHEIKAFSIYPNPTFDSFKIQTEAQINGVVVYDNVGKMVQKFEKATDNYDISKLSKGVYFLEINTVAGQKSYEKIVKE